MGGGASGIRGGWARLQFRHEVFRGERGRWKDECLSSRAVFVQLFVGLGGKGNRPSDGVGGLAKLFSATEKAVA